ncbi:hypothetical protein CCACVL1_12313 [Corchorus capsularis]|uniref:ADP-ribosylation factor-like protein 2 n=1 Tax=Corchorus capsularis TaxID=210143 RepID=A0A1R3IGD9_COCAP|nr:hypothetical protein CCACVL1_12313 [Corchorus capsularis]
MEVARASKTLMLWLAMTCIMIAASNVPMGSAEETQGIVECFSSLSSIEGCIEAIDKAVSDKDIKDLGPACCKAINHPTRGLDNSGKTTIVLKINGEDTSVISPTLGFNIKTITYQKYTLNIWDVGGQRTIRSYWRNYFEQTDGLVWVVDSSDLRRLDDCKMELDNLLKEERLSGASLLILANKQDIKGALTPSEIAKVLNLEAMDKTRHWEIVGCSAYTGEGLLEGFDWLVQDIASRIYMLD